MPDTINLNRPKETNLVSGNYPIDFIITSDSKKHAVVGEELKLSDRNTFKLANGQHISDHKPIKFRFKINERP